MTAQRRQRADAVRHGRDARPQGAGRARRPGTVDSVGRHDQGRLMTTHGLRVRFFTVLAGVDGKRNRTIATELPAHAQAPAALHRRQERDLASGSDI